MDQVRVGHLREQSQSPVLQPDQCRPPPACGGSQELGTYLWCNGAPAQRPGNVTAKTLPAATPSRQPLIQVMVFVEHFKIAGVVCSEVFGKNHHCTVAYILCRSVLQGKNLTIKCCLSKQLSRS